MYEIVVNPAGAAGRTLKAWKKAEELFKKSGQEYHVHFSSVDHDIDAICAECTDNEEETKLVIIGGDGSMNRAVNGIRHFDKVRLGFIPCGSGNDLAKALKIPRDPVLCAENILEEKITRVLDIGKVTYHNCSSSLNGIHPEEFSRLFNISCGIGFDAHICQEVAVTKWKKTFNKLHMGKLIYGMLALKVIFQTQMTAMKISIDNREVNYSSVLFACAMNEPYEGGGFGFCPKADGTDGKLDLCIGESLSRLDVFRIFPYAAFGQHTRFKGVHLDQFQSLDIISEKPLWVHQDGEVECKSSHISIAPYAQKLRMLN